MTPKLCLQIAGLLLIGCANSANGPNSNLLPPVNEIGGDRPAEVFYPDNYAEDVSYPLVILLHGFTANAQVQDIIFGLKPAVTMRQFILVTPNGLENPEGDRFWNATNECCDFFDQAPDDVQYVSDLISDARAHFNIDPSRITLVGHSNGGYMANRYACEQIEIITRIVNLAGLSFVNAKDCQATHPVEVLHIHGTNDDAVLYESNVTDGAVSDPSVTEDLIRLRAGAFELAQSWAERAGCDTSMPLIDEAIYDLSNDIAGNETDAITWQNCDYGSSILMRANGVGHTWVDRNEQFQKLVVDFAVQ